MKQRQDLTKIKDQLTSAIYNVAANPIAVFDRDECRLIWDALDRLDQYEARAAAVLAEFGGNDTASPVGPPLD
jgi:hypothetical protein